jgi:hypothetical protein
MAVDHGRLTAFAAQKIVDRHIGDFTFDIPKRLIHSTDGVVQHRAVAPVGIDIHHVPQVFDVGRIATLH